MKHITAEELKKMIDDGADVAIVDSLTEPYFKKRHVPGAINIPVEGFEEKAKELLPDKDKAIVTYCMNTACTASTMAAEKLEEMGYTNVHEFDEGVEGWEKAGYDFEQ